jgi:hypothetical protein
VERSARRSPAPHTLPITLPARHDPLVRVSA